jgi:predicted lipoprotein with Yx(FWY)xxD motif
VNMQVRDETSRRRRTVRRLSLGGVLAAVALTAAACGASASTTTTSGAPASGSGGGTVVVKTAKIGMATVLVDAAGHTLYWFGLDKPGKIACTSSCTVTWPPLLVPSGDHVTSMAGLSTETRPGGEVQVTYKGSPLYIYAGDSKPGQEDGAGIPNWHVASTTSSTSSSTTSTTSSSGYGY